MTGKTFKHGGGVGDFIYGLATMQALGGGILYLNGYSGGYCDSLLRLQPYVEDILFVQKAAEDWWKFKVDFDLDLFRDQDFNKFPIIECHAKAFNLSIDYTKPWIFNVTPNYVADIVINDTGQLRWPGVTVDWSLLEPYKDRCIFLGLQLEYENFIKDHFAIKWHQIQDGLEFAQVSKGSKLYVGNQSSGLAMAEGMKINRVADLYEGRSKQHPYGENGHITLTTELIEKYLAE